MKTILNFAIVIVASMSLVSCFNKNKPNYQYFPNMYVSPSYEAYSEGDIFLNQQSALLPAENSISRGYQPYDYEDSTEGLLLAKAESKSPLNVTEDNLNTGAHLYTLYCAVCHGDKGDGKGILVEREKFLGIPSYADAGREINPGGIYHVQMYGLNSMGSYSSQVDEKERWQIAMHVMDLKAALNGQPSILEAQKDLPVDNSVEADASKVNDTEVETTSNNEVN